MKSTRAHSLTSDPIDIKYAAKSGVVPPGSTDVKVKFKAPSHAGDTSHTLRLHHQPVSDPGTPAVGTTRRRVLTEKGQPMMVEMKEKRLNQLFRRLEKKSDEIYGFMDSGADSKAIQAIYVVWMNLYEELMTVYDDTCKLSINPDLLQNLIIKFNVKHEPVLVCREDINQWLVSQGRQVHHKPKSNVSSVSVSTSGKSKCSSVLSARLHEQQRQAELSAREKALAEEQAIEHTKLKLQQQEERLALQTEQEVCRARTRVIEEFEEEDYSSSHDDITCAREEYSQNICSSVISRPSCIYERRRQTVIQSGYDFDVHHPIGTKPSINTRKASSGSNSAKLSRSSDSHTSEEVIKSVVRELRKPHIEVARFSGDPLTYKKFVRQFETRILAVTDNEDERLAYLDQYTSGEPNRIIRSLSYLDASIAYPAVWKELNDRYGNSEIIATKFVDKALKWPTVRPNDGKALDEYSIFLSECQHAVSSLNSMKIMEYPDNIKKLLGKLPLYMHDRWRNVVERCREKQKLPVFKDLVDFVKLESRKSNHPLYGKDAMNVVPAENRSSTHRSSAAAVSDKPELTPSPDNATSHLCLFCSKDHTLHSCETIRSKPFNERLDFLRSKRLCFGCLKFGHTKVECRNKASCLLCHYRHPYILHIGSESLDQLTS